MLQMMAALAGAGLALTAAALVLWFPGSGEHSHAEYAPVETIRIG